MRPVRTSVCKLKRVQASQPYDPLSHSIFLLTLVTHSLTPSHYPYSTVSLSLPQTLPPPSLSLARSLPLLNLPRPFSLSYIEINLSIAHIKNNHFSTVMSFCISQHPPPSFYISPCPRSPSTVETGLCHIQYWSP